MMTRSKTKEQARNGRKRGHSPPQETSPDSDYQGSPIPKRRENAPKLYTIGHGTRTLPDLISLLQATHVTTLADVRSIPKSRTNPQFNHDALISSPELRKAGIRYHWLGKEIGGLRKAIRPAVLQHSALRVESFRNYAAYMCTPEFREGLDKLKALVEEDREDGGGGVAIMCGETVWWRCHRRMISDVLAERGWDIEHLGVKKDPMKHVLWNIARLDDDGNLIYDDNKQ